MTIVYLIRHSVKLSKKNLINSKLEDKNLYDEKTSLSVIGEKRAEILSNKSIFDDIDIIYSSNMVRSIQTAKYLANRLNLNINVDERLNERRYGIANSEAYPDWFTRQYKYPDFKTVNGESQNDVFKRVYECLNEILNKNENKKIAIFSHGYAITFLLLKWCKLENINEERKLTLSYKNKIVMDKVINAPEVFKLTFDKNKIKSIELIEFDDLPFEHGGI